MDANFTENEIFKFLNWFDNKEQSKNEPELLKKDSLKELEKLLNANWIKTR